MTETQRAAMQAALERFEHLESQPHVRGKEDCHEDIISDLRAALAEPTGKDCLPVAEQKPIAWANVNKQGDITHTSNRRDSWAKTPLYTAPPRRGWVSLTEEERQQILDTTHPDNRWTLAERVEYRLKEKNA